MTNKGNAHRFGENLKKARLKAGISALDLGMKCGMFPNLIYKIENAPSDPRLSTAVALSGALGLKVDDLLG